MTAPGIVSKLANPGQMFVPFALLIIVSDYSAETKATYVLSGRASFRRSTWDKMLLLEEKSFHIA
jgi:hypothetical protein